MPSSNSSIVIPFRGLFSVLLFLPFVLACQQDVSVLVPLAPGQGETAQVTLSIRIPDFRAAHTRAVNEERITQLTVLMFADEGGTEKVKVKYDVPWSSLHALPGSPDTGVFSVPVAAGRYKRIALIANAQAELVGITVGSTYDALKQVEATGKFGQKGEHGTFIPMYGEYVPAGGFFELKAGVSQTIAQAIPLIRMLARVDIVNLATSGAGTIEEEIYFINPVGNGRIWVDPTTYNTTASQSGYMAPTLPGTLQPANGSDPIRVMAKSGTNLVTYYLNEQPATSTTLYTFDNNRPCIVLPLSYKGSTYYYRLDYTWDGSKGGGTPPYEKGKYMPILRNHRYIFTIKEVKGPGYRSMLDALQSPESHTNQNIVVVPIVIDEAFTDITFSESGYFLAVNRTAMTLQGKHDATSTQNKFSVRTNYPGGWKAEARNADGTSVSGSSPWLKPGRGSGATGATLTNPVTEELRAITSGKGFKEGYLEVRAGRLSTKLSVEQIAKLPLDYVAERNLAGGFKYGSSFNDPYPTPTSAQTDMEFRWAANHNNNQSGYYSYLVTVGEDYNNYNPNLKKMTDDSFFTTGVGKGYHVPSESELTSIFSDYNGNIAYGYSVDKSDANEACEFGGIKMTFAADYYSSGNGVCYAIRLKQGTGNEPDDNRFSLANYPAATDNRMLCAFRYTRVGPTTENNLTAHLKVDCVYLGETGASMPVATIANDGWWSARSSETTTRIFPLAGRVSPGTPMSHNGSLGTMGERAWYVSCSEEGGRVVHMNMSDGSISVRSGYYHDLAMSLRLFADE